MPKNHDPLYYATGPELAVIPDLPRGFHELKYAKPRQAVAPGNKILHFCGKCGGWISGHPLCQTDDDRENFHDGRRGRVLRCRRCGEELSFFGVFNKEAPPIPTTNKYTNTTNRPAVRIQRGTGGIGG
jgi:hypothetical protein